VTEQIVGVSVDDLVHEQQEEIDRLGLLVEAAGRLLATIVNEAASAVADSVSPPESIDTAMRLGANYPSGPLEWGERIGLVQMVRTLDTLDARDPDGSYRVVPLLRSLAESDGSFFAPRP
jgi:3-hydroxyacyl-CoA dehydrogenase